MRLHMRLLPLTKSILLPLRTLLKRQVQPHPLQVRRRPAEHRTPDPDAVLLDFDEVGERSFERRLFGSGERVEGESGNGEGVREAEETGCSGEFGWEG